MNTVAIEQPLGIVSSITLTDRQIAMLNKLEKYDLWFVVERLERKKLIQPIQIAQAIDEFKRYIALICLGYKGLAMCSREVDEVWHSFILFTREYNEFCYTVTGKFIHHSPNTSRRSIPQQSMSNFVEAYTKFFGEPPTIWQIHQSKEQSMVYDGCGEEEGSSCDN